MAERIATILHTTADVAEWRRVLLSRRSTRDLPDVRFALDFLSVAENDGYTTHAGRLKQRCGCEAGGLGGAFTLFIALLVFAVPLTRPALSWTAVGTALAAVLAVSIATKVCALAWARLALVRLASALIHAAQFESHAPRGGSYGTRLQ